MAGPANSTRLGLVTCLAAILAATATPAALAEGPVRTVELGITVGTLPAGPLNMITDVKGVKVGHRTMVHGDDVRTGVTAVLPHGGNVFQAKTPAAVYNFNSFGKMAGSLQVDELGNIESPIVLTNTLSVGTAVEATAAWVLSQPGNEDVRSVNALVGETNDGYLNDIRGQHVSADDVVAAITSAAGGTVAEDNVGAGTGTRSFGFKSGIGTASRMADPIADSRYTVGVLVQSNFGSELQFAGLPVSRLLAQERTAQAGHGPDDEDGSIMIIIATDAPLDARNLRRMARRAFSGMARTTAFMSNFSGDFAIAFSTAYTIPPDGLHTLDPAPALIDNSEMNTLFRAVEEATQEAIYNALLMAESMSGRDGHHLEAIPRAKLRELLMHHRLADAAD